MIEELTTEQKAKLPFYRNKWLQIGLDTERSDKAEVEHWIREAYIIADVEPPEKIFHTLSPLGCLNKYEELTGDNAIREIGGFSYGSHEAGWLCVYDFYLQECGLEVCEKLKPLMEVAKVCGWWLPYEEAAIVSAKPTLIKMDDGRLHCDDGPACEYEDGFKVSALNGVRVRHEIASTPGENMPISWWADEVNVEVRHEIEKKMGTERILDMCKGQTLHTDIIEVGSPNGPREELYTVIEIALPNGDKRNLLSMINPSTGDKHKEWIPPHVATVQDALKFRNGTDELPSQLTQVKHVKTKY